MRILFLNKAPESLRSYDVARIEALLNSYASKGTRIEVGFPDDFPGSQVKTALGGQRILNGLDHQMDTPALIKKIVWAQDNGYDAVIQSNTFDPGVEGARLAQHGAQRVEVTRRHMREVGACRRGQRLRAGDNEAVYMRGKAVIRAVEHDVGQFGAQCRQEVCVGPRCVEIGEGVEDRYAACGETAL